jgi:hypothetical protein
MLSCLPSPKGRHADWQGPKGWVVKLHVRSRNYVPPCYATEGSAKPRQSKGPKEALPMACLPLRGRQST